MKSLHLIKKKACGCQKRKETFCNNAYNTLVPEKRIWKELTAEEVIHITTKKLSKASYVKNKTKLKGKSVIK